jgi:hypothetical protein
MRGHTGFSICMAVIAINLSPELQIAYALFIDPWRQKSISISPCQNAIKCCNTVVFYAVAA